MIAKTLIVFLCLIQIFSAYGQLHTFKNLSYKDGLNLGTINCIEQSADGYLWIGTDGAELVRYDGQEFKEIFTEKSDNNHHVTNISFDNNEILIASRYKGFLRYNTDSNTYQRINTHDKHVGESRAVFKQDNKYYLIGTRGILSSDDDSTKELFKVHKGQPEIKITQIIPSPDAFFILSNYGIFKISAGKSESISEWTKSEIYNEKEFIFGHYDKDKLTLLTAKGDRWLEIITSSRGGFFSIQEFNEVNNLAADERIISYSHSPKSLSSAVLTSKGSIYAIKQRQLKKIAHNYNKPLEEAHSIKTDMNGDFWIASYLKGIYKVSKEPFTKMQLQEVYEKPNISLPFQTVYGDIIMSVSSDGTYLGKNGVNKPFRRFDFSINSITEVSGKYYLGTNDGIRTYHPTDNPNFNKTHLSGKKINFVKAEKNRLWVGIAGKGLHELDLKTGAINKFSPEEITLPNYIYSGEISPDSNIFYFGTNNGIFQYNKKEKRFSRIKYDNKYGSYSGCSTIDKYGTIWFTTEKALVGISKSRKIKQISGPQFFNSYLFYTLSSDDSGNLLIGTNKGLTIIKTNEQGTPQSSTHYNDNNGYTGHEAFMRSEFKSESGIFIGTIEGLYLVNTDLLNNKLPPLPPIIIRENIDKNDKTNHNNLITLKVNNPKAGEISFIYRVSSSENWTKLPAGENSFMLNDLKNGSYNVEVKSTYDGVYFSEPSKHSFNVNLPFWKTNWFIISSIGIIVLVNILLMRFYKTFDDEKLMDTKDLDIYLNSTPRILLFASLASPISQITAPYADPQLEMHLGLSLSTAFILLTLYFLTLAAKKKKKNYLFKRYLTTGFLVVMANFLWEVYSSGLHPFFIIGVALIGMVIPFVINKVRNTIIISLIIFFISVCYALILNDTVYPKWYFLVAMLTMCSLMIFASYMRYDSLEKLIFISGIINKGNVPAIAFNKKGIVTYASENISQYMDITHDRLVNNNIGILNKFVPFEGHFKQADITNEFKDGEKYLVPLLNSENEIHWLEWSYKDFSNNIRVIIGQDVTEKMNLENTYELLVQNAEDFIYQCDVEGRFTFLNDISYEKMGYTKEDLIGMHPSIIVPEEYQQKIIDFYADHFTKKKTTSYLQFPIKKKDGSIIWVGQYVTTIFSKGSDYNISGFIALARDITDIREQQKTIIEQSDAITSSINYARRIQYNLLPHESQFSNCFDEHFIFSKPKDIVSGDFYWMEKVDNQTVLVMADCTGHGVPGSFMTLLGFNLLNSIVLEGRQTDPSKILTKLDTKLQEYLPKGEGETAVNDGMEMTICVFDENSNEISYACAGSRFLVFQQEDFTMFKGDNKHIGDIEENFTGYNTHYANFEKSYNLFLFTDGFQDQFGGPKDKKFSFRRLLELLESNINLPLTEQRKMIESNFDQWIGDNDQTDDVSILSIRKKI